jgi:Sortase domain
MARVVVLLAALAVGVTGCSGQPEAVVTPSAPATSRVQPSTPSPTSPVAGTRAPAPAAGAGLARSAPVRLQVAAIGLDSPLMSLGLQADGTMQVPKGGFPAGWYTGGPTPGELGPGVIAGHVDMKGPGVFYRLHELRPGDRVVVTRQDGSKPVFRVTRLALFPKDQFPTRLVYGNTNRSVLRLITCGGSFNSRTGHYEDNIIAFADLVGP